MPLPSNIKHRRFTLSRPVTGLAQRRRIGVIVNMHGSPPA